MMDEPAGKSVAARLAEAAATRETAFDLVKIAREQLAAGVTREDLIEMCNEAIDLSETEEAEGYILDLMDRVVGYPYPQNQL